MLNRKETTILVYRGTKRAQFCTRTTTTRQTYSMNNSNQYLQRKISMKKMPEMNSETFPSINNIKMDIFGLENLLKNLETKKASGPDQILKIVLKECSNELAPIISHIFQLSLDNGTSPEDRRNANISPIFKKGDRHTAANYRPVSLTCIWCKMLELIICRHIMNHLE